MHILNVGVGMTFSGGLIDLVLFGILHGNTKTNWIWIIVIGLLYMIIYYFVFYYMIKWLNLKTPGREADGEVTKLYTRSDMKKGKASDSNGNDDGADDVSAKILKGLGGRDNLSDLDCCATRLRVTVKNSDLVEDRILKDSGASGVIHKGKGVQIIYGPQVSVIKSNLEEFLDNEQDSVLENESDSEANDKIIKLYAHMKGRTIPIEKVNDEAFSSKALGDGAAIEPTEGKLYSPCDGKVETVFDTKHAITLISEEGCEILLHIGIDTVQLGGSFFEAHVKDGQNVKRGELLISFDMENIKEKGYQLTTPIVICNTDDYTFIELIHTGDTEVGKGIIEIAN